MPARPPISGTNVKPPIANTSDAIASPLDGFGASADGAATGGTAAGGFAGALLGAEALGPVLGFDVGFGFGLDVRGRVGSDTGPPLEMSVGQRPPDR